MKRILLCSLMFGILSASSYAASVSLNAPAVVAGSTFDVDLNVQNVFAGRPGDVVTGFGFNVSVGSPMFTFSGVTVNSTYFDVLAPCCGTDVTATNNFTFIAGVSASDFVEPLLLATLHFSVNGPGSTTVGVSADSSNPNQGLFFLFDSESFGDSKIVTALAVPESATLVGVLVGLAGLAGLRKLRP